MTTFCPSIATTQIVYEAVIIIISITLALGQQVDIGMAGLGGAIVGGRILFWSGMVVQYKHGHKHENNEK